MTKKNKLFSIITVLLGLGLLISILPLIYSSFYARPIADDFGFSASVKHVVENDGNIIEVLSASAQEVSNSYMRWQGTYSAVFLFSLQPGIYSGNYYFLTTVVMLSSLIFSTIIIAVEMTKILGLNTKYGFFTSFIILLLSIHFVVDKNEAFFWWNGSSYYTLFYSFSLLLYSLLIKTYYANKTGRAVCFGLSIILSAIIGGGNYSTALITAIVLALAVCIVAKSKRKLLPFYVIVFIVFAAGFVISITAPGNSVRAEAVTGESPIKAIIDSVYYALIYIAKWTGLPQLAGFSLIALISLVKLKDTRLRFRYPLIVLILSVLIFAAQFTPSLYAMSSVGSGRQINIYYYSYYLLVTFNIVYLCGWINRNGTIAIKREKISAGNLITGSLVICGVFVAGCLNNGLRSISFVDTIVELKKGTPQAYSIEYEERMSEIESGNTTIEEINTIPDFFAPLGIEEEPDFWVNKQMAKYYCVDSISKKPAERNLQ